MDENYDNEFIFEPNPLEGIGSGKILNPNTETLRASQAFIGQPGGLHQEEAGWESSIPAVSGLRG